MGDWEKLPFNQHNKYMFWELLQHVFGFFLLYLTQLKLQLIVQSVN